MFRIQAFGGTVLIVLSLLVRVTPTAAATIDGIVTNAAGLPTPIPGVRVQIYSPFGPPGPPIVECPATDLSGRFTCPPLAPGTYYARTWNFLGYVNQLYDSRTCFGDCNPREGTPILLSTPDATYSITFRLKAGGGIGGTVRIEGSGLPAAGVQIRVLDVSRPGFGGSGSMSSPTGYYEVRGLPGGTYLVRTFNTMNLVDEAYDDILCMDCLVSIGTPVEVPWPAGDTPAITRSGIDFSLRRGGGISGRVTDSATATGVPNARVEVFDAMGWPARSAVSGPGGEYRVSGLLEGAYYLRAIDQSPTPPAYATQLFDRLPCLGECRTVAGTPVSVVAGSDRAGVDFPLEPGGSIEGTISAEPDAPLQARVQILDRYGNPVTSANAAPSGAYTWAYTTLEGLPSGAYLALAQNRNGYPNELFDDILCFLGCVPLFGQPIEVVAPATRSGIDFNLNLGPGARIRGRVLNSLTGNGVPGALVTVTDPWGRPVSQAVTDGDGNYITDNGLLPVPLVHFARTSADSYVGEVYNGAGPDILCAGSFSCYMPAGAPIAVFPGSTMPEFVDFAIQPGAHITGRVTDQATGRPIAGASVEVIDPTLDSVARRLGERVAIVASAFTDSTGAYLTQPALPPGLYHVRAGTWVGYLLELYNERACPTTGPCLTGGDPVAVTAGETVGGIDFTLQAGANLSGTGRATTGEAVRGVGVQFFDAAGNRAENDQGDLEGRYVTRSVRAGTYYARTTNRLGYLNRVYGSAVSCLNAASCDPSSGTPIPIDAGSLGTIVRGLDFTLEPDTDADGDGIFGSIDRNRTTLADESAMGSLEFTDTRMLGTTSGIIATRGSWTLQVMDISSPAVPGSSSTGVQASVTGTGPRTEAELRTCGAGEEAELVVLDEDHETAFIACSEDGGTTAVRAIATREAIELRGPATGPGTIVHLVTGQEGAVGSPVSASLENTGPVAVSLVDADDNELASLQLDPGESVDATVAQGGSFQVSALSGSVDLTVPGSPPTPIEGGETFCSTPESILAAAASPSTLWPPNHRMVPVAIGVSLAGTCAPAACRIVSVTSNEPTNGLGDGDTAPDWEITGDLTVKLRAERSGKGSGRVYSVTVECTDAAGNKLIRIVTVTVPHDRGKDLRR